MELGSSRDRFSEPIRTEGWRHGVAGVTIEPCERDDDDTIHVSPLTLEPYNMDFDGDTAALYQIHSHQALEELNGPAHVVNTITYDSNRTMLSIIRHESLYAAFTLTANKPNSNYQTTHFHYLQDLEENVDLWNHYLDCPVKINNDPNIYPYGICLVNKWLGFEKVKFNFTVHKKSASDLSNIIYQNSSSNEEYYDRLNELNKKLLAFITMTNHSPSVDVEEMINMVDHEDEKLIQNLPDNNMFVGYTVNEALIDRCIEKANQESDLLKLYKSGSRFDKQQLARTAISVGYTADAENIIDSQPIRTNLLKGLTKDDFFLSSPGSRKGRLCNAL